MCARVCVEEGGKGTKEVDWNSFCAGFISADIDIDNAQLIAWLQILVERDREEVGWIVRRQLWPVTCGRRWLGKFLVPLPITCAFLSVLPWFVDPG